MGFCGRSRRFWKRERKQSNGDGRHLNELQYGGTCQSSLGYKVPIYASNWPYLVSTERKFYGDHHEIIFAIIR